MAWQSSCRTWHARCGRAAACRGAKRAVRAVLGQCAVRAALLLPAHAQLTCCAPIHPALPAGAGVGVVRAAQKRQLLQRAAAAAGRRRPRAARARRRVAVGACGRRQRRRRACAHCSGACGWPTRFAAAFCSNCSSSLPGVRGTRLILTQPARWSVCACCAQGLGSSMPAPPPGGQQWLPDRSAMRAAGLAGCSFVPEGAQSALLQGVPGGGTLLVLGERPK